MEQTDYVIMPSTDYKAACDAIRAKTGKTALIKSGDMGTEIASIESGVGESDYLPDDEIYDDVRFYDMDGGIISRLSIAEANALTALPVPPAHEGFTFQEWNYTLAEVQTTTRPLDIGANYITADGVTTMRISCIGFSGRNISGTSTFTYHVDDAGEGLKIYLDGTLQSTITESGDHTLSIGFVMNGASHYRTIAFEPDGNCAFYPKSLSSFKVSIGSSSVTITPQYEYIRVGHGYVFKNALSSGYYENIPTGITSITVANSLNAKYCHIPRTVTSITANPNMLATGFITTFPNSTTVLPAQLSVNNSERLILPPDVEMDAISINTNNAKYVCLPKTLNSITNLVAYKMRHIMFPESVCHIAKITSYAIRKITIPENIVVNSTSTSAFLYDCKLLKTVKWENTMTNINKQLYYGCRSLISPTFPKGATSISALDMGQCTAVNRLIIPSGIQSIGLIGSDARATMELLVLPETLTAFTTTPFDSDYMYSLRAVVCLAQSAPTRFSDVFGYANPKCAWNIYVPDDSLSSYINGLTASEKARVGDRLKPLSEYPGGFSLDKL